VYAGFLSGNTQITAASALVLSLGIAIQNFPEGAIISMPLRAEGERKGRAFLGGVLSGVVEPIGAVLTLLAARLKSPVKSSFTSLSQRHIQHHHHAEAYRKEHRSKIRVPPLRHFRNQLLNHHIEHGARCKAQQIRQPPGSQTAPREASAPRR